MSKLVRIIMHWTAGPKNVTNLDKKHYHEIVAQDLTCVLGNHAPEDNLNTGDGNYAAHTFMCNTGSIGLAMAGMRLANQSPLKYGPDPLTAAQCEKFCERVAWYCVKYGIPVSRTTVLTHAEVQPTLGIKQRGKWDITVLKFKPNLVGPLPVGDFLRERVRAHVKKLQQQVKPELKLVENPPAPAPLVIEKIVEKVAEVPVQPRSVWSMIKSWFV